MNRVNDINTNTKSYWDSVYKGRDNREKYEAESFGPLQTSLRFYRAIDEIKDGQKVLDIGCGVGIFTKMVKNTFPNCEVWGTDISSQAIEDDIFERPDIKYFHQYIGNQTDLPDNYFDFVFCGEVLEHLEDPNLLFKDANRVLKTGGHLLITTPLLNRVNSVEHIWSFDYPDIEKLYEDNGFRRPSFIYLPNMEHLVIIMANGKKL